MLIEEPIAGKFRGVEIGNTEKIFDVRTSIISSPRCPSDIYAEQEEDGIRTHVLTIMKLTPTR